MATQIASDTTKSFDLMNKLSGIGRVFYGIAIAGMGVQTVYYDDFPYMLLPPNRVLIPGLAAFAYVGGFLLVVAGLGIIFKKQTRMISLVLGTVLLAICCVYYIPYELLATTNYMHLVEWENAEKELALAAGALVIAGCFSERKEKPLTAFFNTLIPAGAILFAATIISFGILHFLYAREAATLVPAWIPGALLWTYFGGVALIGAGLAIILKIKQAIFAPLLGTMIFSWFVVLHIPRVIASAPGDLNDELASAFLALAYGGIALVIGENKPKKSF